MSKFYTLQLHLSIAMLSALQVLATRHLGEGQCSEQWTWSKKEQAFMWVLYFLSNIMTSVLLISNKYNDVLTIYAYMCVCYT